MDITNRLSSGKFVVSVKPRYQVANVYHGLKKLDMLAMNSPIVSDENLKCILDLGWGYAVLGCCEKYASKEQSSAKGNVQPLSGFLSNDIIGPGSTRLRIEHVEEFVLEIVVTSGPSSVWPRKAYRNPTDQLVGFLDRKHGQDWSIFEFRAEGTGYPDSEVYNRIHHFPWPDHHPPPFAIIPNLMAAMRNWIQCLDREAANTIEKDKRRIAVVHCKAGKGRSGTVACSYLISEEAWKREDALQRFTSRRMRAGFGQGVSIPSQLRWVSYVDRWTNTMGKMYVERPIEIVELHIWGLRDGVKVAIEGYVDSGRRIQHFHTFTRAEKTVMDSDAADKEMISRNNTEKDEEILISPTGGTPRDSSTTLVNNSAVSMETIVLRPAKPVVLPTSDVNIDFERRNKASYTGFTMVTSIAHVWFNAYFEGGHDGHDSGVFEIEWAAMDGIKGSVRKGIQALDRLKVVWKYAKGEGQDVEKVISEPAEGEPVPEGEPADWRGQSRQKEQEAKHSDGLDSGRPGGAALTMGAMINEGVTSISKELGLRHTKPESADISRASSIKDLEPSTPKSATVKNDEAQSDDEGVKSYDPDVDPPNSPVTRDEVESRQDTRVGRAMEAGMEKFSNLMAMVKPGDNSEKDAAAKTPHPT